MCPTLAITYQRAPTASAWGWRRRSCWSCSNLVISLLRNFIPDKVPHSGVHRDHCHFRHHRADGDATRSCPILYDTLGVFIPLIVVNCIIFARAEAFAFKNPPLASARWTAWAWGWALRWRITLLSCDPRAARLRHAARVRASCRGGYQPMCSSSVQPAGGFITAGA